MNDKNRLTLAYYSITFWDFKSLQSVSKTWEVLQNNIDIFLKMSKSRNTVFYDDQSRFLVIFSSNYRLRVVLKIPFPDHIFPKMSKYRTENLHFLIMSSDADCFRFWDLLLFEWFARYFSLFWRAEFDVKSFISELILLIP